MTIFEELGIEYKEIDGLLYPVLSVSRADVTEASIGKYGRMWMAYMKDNHAGRYKSLLRFGRLNEMAVEVNEEAYELLEAVEERWLSKRMPKAGNSFKEMCQLRMQARLMAEEVVLEQVVRQFH